MNQFQIRTPNVGELIEKVHQDLEAYAGISSVLEEACTALSTLCITVATSVGPSEGLSQAIARMIPPQTNNPVIQSAHIKDCVNFLIAKPERVSVLAESDMAGSVRSDDSGVTARPPRQSSLQALLDILVLPGDNPPTQSSAPVKEAETADHEAPPSTRSDKKRRTYMRRPRSDNSSIPLLFR